MVERDDNPMVEGTPCNASTMNDLQDRISNITIDLADFSNDGLMSAQDKQKLNGIQRETQLQVARQLREAEMTEIFI